MKERPLRYPYAILNTGPAVMMAVGGSHDSPKRQIGGLVGAKVRCRWTDHPHVVAGWNGQTYVVCGPVGLLHRTPFEMEVNFYLDPEHEPQGVVNLN